MNMCYRAGALTYFSQVTVPAVVQKVLPKTPTPGTKKKPYIVATLLLLY